MRVASRAHSTTAGSSALEPVVDISTRATGQEGPWHPSRTPGHPELDVVILVSAPIGQPTAIEIWLDRAHRGTGVGADAVGATATQKAAERLRRDIRVALL